LGARKISGDKAVVVAGIPFVVSNSGDATLEDITVTFRFHVMFRRDALEQLKFTTTGIFTATQIQRSFTTNGPLHYSSYLIPGLNPGQTLVGAEPVYLPQTKLDLTVPLETRDKKATNVSMSVEFALEFLASIAAKDMTTRDYHMTLETAEAESLDDLAQRATSRIRRDLGKAREATTFGQYLRALVFGVPDEFLYLIFAELDEHRAGDGTLHFARPDARVRRLSYSPVSWQRLFR
jgi:hypothetical protein